MAGRNDSPVLCPKSPNSSLLPIKGILFSQLYSALTSQIEKKKPTTLSDTTFRAINNVIGFSLLKHHVGRC